METVRDPSSRIVVDAIAWSGGTIADLEAEETLNISTSRVSSSSSTESVKIG